MNPYSMLKIDPSIRMSKVVHNPNEFIVTFGGTYHQGFNWGFNMAEAVNFATDSWLGLCLRANNCQCHKDSVKIDHEEIFLNLQKTDFSRTEKFKMFAKARQNKNKRLIQQLIDNKVKDHYVSRSKSSRKPGRPPLKNKTKKIRKPTVIN